MTTTAPLWLVCGSGPSARDGMRLALSEHGSPRTITCNGGHRLFDVRTGLDAPDVYFLSDAHACEVYGPDSHYMQRVFGTRVVTLRRNEHATRCRGLEHSDEFLEVHRTATACRHHPGLYPPHPLSGMFMVDYALNHGAETVLVCGFDGYRSIGGETCIDYFDGRKGHGRSELHNPNLSAYLESAAFRRPGVRFEFYGPSLLDFPTLDNCRRVEGVTT